MLQKHAKVATLKIHLNPIHLFMHYSCNTVWIVTPMYVCIYLQALSICINFDKHYRMFLCYIEDTSFDPNIKRCMQRTLLVTQHGASNHEWRCQDVRRIYTYVPTKI